MRQNSTAVARIVTYTIVICVIGALNTAYAEPNDMAACNREKESAQEAFYRRQVHINSLEAELDDCKKKPAAPPTPASSCSSQGSATGGDGDKALWVAIEKFDAELEKHNIHN